MRRVVLSVSKLSVCYRRDSNQRILDDITFSLRKGECLCVIGDSGSGKTTLLRALVGLLPVDLQQNSGTISIQGSNINQNSIKSLWGEVISVVFQDPRASLHPTLTIARQFEILLREQDDTKTSDETIKKETIRLLREVKIADISHILQKKPAELSGGTCQRINIALALIKNPTILLLDEPTASLDYSRREAILKLLNRIRKQRGLSILFVTHDLNIVQDMADKVIVLEEGRIIGRVTRRSSSLVFLDGVSKRVLSDSKIFMRDERLHESSDELIRLSHVSKSYNGQKVIRDGNMSIYKHDRLGIVGESGGGKSTLAKIIAGYETPTSGSVIDIQNSRIELVLQDIESSVNPHHTVREVLIEYSLIRRQAVPSDSELYDYLKLLGLQCTILSKKAIDISGGQRQRIVIARALLSRPDIIIFDEPTSALDASSQKQTLQLIKALSKRFNFAYVIISHDMTVVNAMCQRAIIVKDGSIMTAEQET